MTLKKLLEYDAVEISLETFKRIVKEANNLVINGGEFQSFDISRGSDDHQFILSFSYTGWSYESVDVYVI